MFVRNGTLIFTIGWFLPNVITLDFEQAFHWGLQQGSINEEDCNAETFGSKD
jgi:hypothetical protein